MMDFDSFEEGLTIIEIFLKIKGWREWMWKDVSDGKNRYGCG